MFKVNFLLLNIQKVSQHVSTLLQNSRISILYSKYSIHNVPPKSNTIRYKIFTKLHVFKSVLFDFPFIFVDNKLKNMGCLYSALRLEPRRV